jgi:hypothetical protein
VLVPSKPFQPSQMLLVSPRAYSKWGESPSTTISLGWKFLSGKYALAYYDK